jgi:copper homeostasis protein
MKEGHIKSVNNRCAELDGAIAPQLEICAETPQACLAAFEGGAHRIEICAALNEGGITPSDGLIRGAIAAANGLPVYVILRPRSGNFVYSDAEFRIMCADLEHAGSLGASGFAAGILTSDGTVDELRMRHLIRLAGDKEVTFHRAFDHTQNLKEALERIIAIGCQRVLTSGGKPTVREGMNTIGELVQQATHRLRIAAGGGVTPTIAAELRRIANVDVHVSLRRKNRFSASPIQDPLWDRRHDSTDISVKDVQEMASVLAGSQACA